MSTATTMGGPLYAVPAPAAQQRPLFALLLTARRQLRQTFDRMLAAPAAAAGFVRRTVRFGWLTGTPLARAAAWLLGRLSFTGHLVRSVGVVPVALAVVSSPTDEWQVSDRRYLSEGSMALLTPPEPTALEPRRDDVSEVIDQAALQTA